MARITMARLALLASYLSLFGPSSAPLSGVLLCGAMPSTEAADANGVSMDAVPMPSINHDGRMQASPPAGPLPDPLDCSNDGTCSQQEETAPEHQSEPPSSSPSSTSSSIVPSASASAVPTGKYYCPYSAGSRSKINRRYDMYTSTTCFYDRPHSSSSSTTSNETAISQGDFVSPQLEPGQLAPILWRHNGKLVNQYALQVGLPETLTTALLNYCNELGMTDLFRKYTTTHPIEAGDEHKGEFVKLTDGNKWYAQRPGKKWESNMHWISPADEKTHEAYLRVLGEGGFDEVLEGIGAALGLDGLVAYHLTFIGVSHSERGFPHHDSTDTEGGVYNVIIPLLLEDDVPPELILWDDIEDETRGGYKYRPGVGAMMGDDAIHGTYECDYRNLTNAKHGGYYFDDENDGGKRRRRSGMRLAATVYIAEIYPENVYEVAKRTLTQIFPLRDEKWLLAQEARHWQAEWADYTIENRMVGDEGRWAFRADDQLRGEVCEEREERGLCESDVEGTRKKCAFSCKVYIEEGPTKIERVVDDDTAAAAVNDDGDDAITQSVDVCVLNRIGIEECQVYDDDLSIPGDFITPDLGPGEMFPIVWRSDTKRTTDYAFQIGLPSELTEALLEYCDEVGIEEALRELTGDHPVEVDPDGKTSHEFIELRDGNDWYIQRPPQYWQSNMHWISPADEATHEDYLKILAAGNFDLVLNAIGSYLGLEGLAAYHLSFIGVSHSEKGYVHRDTYHTGASVYNVIIPLILEDDEDDSTTTTPELIIADWDVEDRFGTLKYKVGTAAMMGDDAMHGTAACDYRSTKGMRLAATVYIADINDKNAKKIVKQTLTQVFPPKDPKWVMTQRGRHWNEKGTKSLAKDEGRNSTFAFRDRLSDCEERAEEGKCYEDLKHTRVKCLKSCGIYEQLDANNTNSEKEEEVKKDPEFVFDEYAPGRYIKAFFDSLDEDEEREQSCPDDVSPCKGDAASGLCTNEEDEISLYCLNRWSQRSFSLGVDQVMEAEEDEDDSEDVGDEMEINEEKEPPSPSDVAKVMFDTEMYFINEIFAYDDMAVYRASCQNSKKNCAVWAAQGYCKTAEGWMFKYCAAACRNCPMVERANRCPIDTETNIFKPGDINAMFERWMEEAGQDTSSFSSENLPTGGKHPFGEMSVITSPYHDIMQYLTEDEKDNPEGVRPMPWVVAIDGFLTGEECDRLIELGGAKGYERSTKYSDETSADGSVESIESAGRTSTNTFCDKGCHDDLVVKGVIKRMTKLTGVPYDNYESLQLVRYEPGQFYEQHHDLSMLHNDYPYGPRILTVFLYLNDVESGGGTKFDDLQFTAQPKRGSALVWPSLTDDLEELEDWTWHEALPVERGVKFGANAWIHLRDFQNVPAHCAE